MPAKPTAQSLTYAEFLHDFRECQRQARTPGFSFLLGSGTSLKSGIPTGDKFVNVWLRQIFEREATNEADRKLIADPKPPATAADKRESPSERIIRLSSLTDPQTQRLKEWSEKNLPKRPGFKGYKWDLRAHYYGALYSECYKGNRRLGQDALKEVIIGKRPTAGHLHMAMILGLTKNRLVITTNFDRLTEDALAIMGGTAALTLGHETIAKFLDQAYEMPIVAKVHGDIFLETYNATADIDQLRKEWQTSLLSILKARDLIVMGYGGNDVGLMQFLSEHYPQLDRTLYWCHLTDRRPDDHPLIKALSKSPGFRWVPIDGFDEVAKDLSQDCCEADLMTTLKNFQSSIRAQIEGDSGMISGTSLDSSSSSITEDESGDANPIAKEAEALIDKGHYGEAVKLLEKEWSLVKAQGERGDRPALAVGSALARAYRLHARLDDGLQLQRNVLALQEKSFGAEHEDTLSSLNSLANLLSDQGDLAAAGPLYRRALEARERTLGPEHPSTLNSLNNLALLLSDQGDLAAAEPLYRRALEARERSLGPEHPDTLVSLNNLANLLSDQGDLAAAEPLYRCALEAYERILGSEHPYTLMSLNNLAILLKGKGDLAAAEPLYRRALEARERSLGPEHPETLVSLNNLGALHETRGELKEALPYLRRAVAGAQKLLLPEHPHRQAYESNLKRVEQALRKDKPRKGDGKVR